MDFKEAYAEKAKEPIRNKARFNAALQEALNEVALYRFKSSYNPQKLESAWFQPLRLWSGKTVFKLFLSRNLYRYDEVERRDGGFVPPPVLQRGKSGGHATAAARWGCTSCCYRLKYPYAMRLKCAPGTHTTPESSWHSLTAPLT
jgi:hypothetical protein